MRSVRYVRRRWATPAGEALILRWCGAVAVVGGYAVAVQVLWTRGLLPASLNDLTTPWRRIREFGAPDETMIPLALALGLLLGLPKDAVLASAAEQWPQNRVFPTAVDQLYGD